MNNFWSKIQWLGNWMIIVATVILSDPKIASESITPWVILFTANIIFITDSIKRKNIPYIYQGIFLGLWDLFTIFLRINNISISQFL